MSQLPESDTLMAIAQIAATFVGFSTVYFVFDKDRMNVQRRLFLRTVAETGLAALFGSFLPVFVVEVVGDIEKGWRISAAIFALAWLFGMISDSMKYWRAGVSASFTGKLYSPDVILNVIGISILAWTAIATPSISGTLYSIAMILVLAIAAGSFVAGAFARRQDSN